MHKNVNFFKRKISNCIVRYSVRPFLERCPTRFISISLIVNEETREYNLIMNLWWIFYDLLRIFYIRSIRKHPLNYELSLIQMNSRVF